MMIAEIACFKLAPMETPVCHRAMIHHPDGDPFIIHQRKLGLR